MARMKNIQVCRNIISNTVSLRHGVATVLVFFFCLVQLSGCGIITRNPVDYDGAPSTGVDVSKLKDAVPKVEPHHPYGTRSYVLNGRNYKVLKSSKGYVKKGYASWYGTSFHGKETSTQEKFNLYGMTAASPELPLPSYVEVTNLRNGKKVVVRVNDRGPFCRNRILDLSYAAAQKLGFGEDGVVPVKVVGIDPKTWGKDKIANGKHYAKEEAVSHSKAVSIKNSQKKFLQLGAFAELDNAKQLSERVSQFIDKPVKIEHSSNLYRVQIGPVVGVDQQDKLKQLLEENGFAGVTVVSG